MWLDRLGHTTPQQAGLDSRPNLPLPRRVSGRGSPYITSQQRSARTSTSSLVSASDVGSTTSLLRNASGRANGTSGAAGSSLKQSTTVDDGSESLSVLGKIIGSEASQDGGQGSANPSAPVSILKEEDLDLDFDFAGFSLRDYVARGELDAENDGTVYRSQTVEQCTWSLFVSLFLAWYHGLNMNGLNMNANGAGLMQTNKTRQNSRTFIGLSAHATMSSPR